MKNLFLLTLLVAFTVNTTIAQPQPDRPDHEKRVFYDTEGNIFLQKSLPLYLKFSVTDDDQSENHRLISKSTARYGNPMYLDTEGINYIRSKWAIDPETGQYTNPKTEVLYEIYADGVAPFTAISFSGAPVYRTDGTTFYGKGLKIDLSSTDAVSGVEQTHYALNTNTFLPYVNTLDVDEEGEHILFFYANDNVGNAENNRSRTFVVDVSPPTSAREVKGITYANNILAPSVTFSLSSSDNLAGVKTTYYSIDGGIRYPYRGQISVNKLSDGEHQLTFYSVDNVSNEETVQTFDFYVDKTPPVVIATIEGDQFSARYDRAATRERTFVSSRTKIKFTASDNKAGVKNITYSLNGGETQVYNEPFFIPNKDGLHSITYFGSDNVENSGSSEQKGITIYMDDDAPTTGIDYGQPQFFSRDTLFVNKETAIRLFANDGGSGVAEIKYNVNEGDDREYNNPFNIDNEGYHQVQFWAKDNVNNLEDQKTSTVFVDNQGPEVYHNFSIEKIGTQNKEGVAYNIYPNYTRLFLGATDKHCGTEKIEYRIDGRSWREYSSPQTLDISELKLFSKNKFYTVEVRATDKLGNTTIKNISFFVGKN